MTAPMLSLLVTLNVRWTPIVGTLTGKSQSNSWRSPPVGEEAIFLYTLQDFTNRTINRLSGLTILGPVQEDTSPSDTQFSDTKTTTP